MDIQSEINRIKDRNKRVELDKEWETSWTRKISIAILTYVVIVSFFLVAEIERPFINAIVPTTGYILSTLSVSFIKTWWLKLRKNNET